jgi:thiamine-monophosphate kinase
VEFGSKAEAEYHSFRLPLPERELISRIRRLASRATPHGRKLVTGIGDDVAVVRLPRGHELLVTTDFSLEGVHFRREWHSSRFIGHHCLTRGLSDIAAMGGEPLAAFLSLALPNRTPQSWVDGFLDGLLRLARQFRVPLAGGDTAESPDGVLADIVVLGSLPAGTATLRSGARPGDSIYVTGKLGSQAAELELLYSGGAGRRPRARAWPVPRLTVGKVLRERGIPTSMIDISDGLSTDLSHICEESDVGAEVWAHAIPCARSAGQSVGLRFALHYGDDYELLFTAAPQTRVPSRISGTAITCIGRIVPGSKLVLEQTDGIRSPLQPRGWEHFRQRSSRQIRRK